MDELIAAVSFLYWQNNVGIYSHKQQQQLAVALPTL